MEQEEIPLFSRSILTRGRIFKALETLLKTQELDDITTKQICDMAEIGKTTFYTHFKDKYDILQWYTNMGHTRGVAKIGCAFTWRDGHNVSTTFYFMHINALRTAYRSEDYNGIEKYSLRRRKDNLKETLTSVKHVEMTPQLDMLVAALASAESAIFVEAMRASKTPSVDEVVDAMIGATPPTLFELLKIPENPQAPAQALAEVEFVNLIFS